MSFEQRTHTSILLELRVSEIIDLLGMTYKNKNTFFVRLGENGSPVENDENKLDPREREQWDRGYVNFGYNSFVSDKVSVNRRLPDVRPEGYVTGSRVYT